MPRIFLVGGPIILLVLSLALTLAVWIHGNDFQHERDLRREMVHTKLDACRLAYEAGGTAGLQKYLNGEMARGGSSTFVEVLAADGSHLKLLQLPKGPGEKAGPVTPAGSAIPSPNWASAWMTDYSNQNRQVWTIGRTRLPDGNAIVVGRLAAQD